MSNPVPDRIAIKNALFALAQAAVFNSPINGLSTWALSSRRLQHWTKVDPSNQPAMFLVQHREDYQNTGRSTPPKRYLDMGIWCYARADSDSLVGDNIIDIMEMALEVALLPDDTPINELTLGGLVYWARIERKDGMFVREPGDMDGQALLILPVRILLP